MRAWCLVGAVFLLYLKESEGTVKVPCTYLTTEFTLPDGNKNLKTCYPEIDEDDDGDFTILPGLHTVDRTTLAFFLQDKPEVKSLPTDLFRVFPGLTVIRFWNCSATLVNEIPFKGLSKLRTLSLFHNKIENIAGDAFADLSSLEYLDLDDNRIHFLGKHTFASLKALKKLNLDINEIEFLHPDIFSSLATVEIINLSRNIISSLDERIFRGMTNVMHIYLIKNRLERIPKNLFQNNLKLKIVRLEENMIKFIDAGVFDHLLNLYNVDLRGNKCVKSDYFAGSFDEINENCDEYSVEDAIEGANAPAVYKKLSTAIENSETQKSELQRKLDSQMQEIAALKSNAEVMVQVNRALQSNVEMISRENSQTHQKLQLIVKQLEANYELLNKRVDAVNETTQTVFSG